MDKETRTNYVEVPFGDNVTKCSNCAGVEAKGLGNCHLGCGLDNSSAKKNCSVMDKEGYCTVCRCPWTAHVNSINYMTPIT